jgi:hypothetical protein
MVSWANPWLSGVALSSLNRNLNDGMMEMMYFRISVPLLLFGRTVGKNQI